jgi:hypothetical protein
MLSGQFSPSHIFADVILVETIKGCRHLYFTILIRKTCHTTEVRKPSFQGSHTLISRLLNVTSVETALRGQPCVTCVTNVLIFHLTTITSGDWEVQHRGTSRVCVGWAFLPHRWHSPMCLHVAKGYGAFYYVSFILQMIKLRPKVMRRNSQIQIGKKKKKAQASWMYIKSFLCQIKREREGVQWARWNPQMSCMVF